MTQNDIFSIIGILSGIGLFLYAIRLLANGLQRAVGERIKKLLDTLTQNRFKGIFVGLLLTIIIQNSTETIVMVVGYVNAGIMNLIQAVSVIMGANIGTAVTSWIVALGILNKGTVRGGASILALCLLLLGSLIYVYSKKKKKQNIGEIFLSLGLVFIALEVISGSMNQLSTNLGFLRMLQMMGDNPFLGIFFGLLVAGILNSSTATIALLQIATIYGIISFDTMVFVSLGAGLGVCITSMISGRNASRIARQAVLINMIYNSFGVLFWGAVFYLMMGIVEPMAGVLVGPLAVAGFYTGYKLLNTIFFLPMYQGLINFSDTILGDSELEPIPKAQTTEIRSPHILLDERILNTPSLAIQAVSNSIARLGKLCCENLTKGLNAVIEQDYELIDEICYMENMIDEIVASLSDFLVKLSNDGLTDRQSIYVKDFMYTVIDLERVGDHAENLAEIAQLLKERNLNFSPMAIEDLRQMREAVLGSITNAVEARETGNLECVRNTLRFEDDVDALEEELRDRHIARLGKKECVPEAGIVYLDVLTNLERVSDHAVNIAGYVKDEA